MIYDWAGYVATHESEHCLHLYAMPDDPLQWQRISGHQAMEYRCMRCGRMQRLLRIEYNEVADQDDK